MTEQETKTAEDLNQDLPKYTLSGGTRRYIAMSLAKKGYRKADEVRKELLKELADKAEQYGGILPLRVLRNMLKEVE